MNVSDIQYTPAQFPVLGKSRKQASESQFAERLKGEPGGAGAPGESASSTGESAILTSSEKAYFEQLFPASAAEIRSYNPYQNDGSKAAVNLGTLVDRKG